MDVQKGIHRLLGTQMKYGVPKITSIFEDYLKFYTTYKQNTLNKN